jgi:midasin
MKAARAACADLAEAAATIRAPFGWEDGPLVTAMRRGEMILIDELNLADDAVIERLNRYGSNMLLLKNGRVGNHKAFVMT